MERLIQYLDILEDAFYVVALLAERIRRILLTLCIYAIGLVAVGLGVVLTLTQPQAGLAVAAILAVTALYRLVTTRIPFVPAPLQGRIARNL